MPHDLQILYNINFLRWQKHKRSFYLPYLSSIRRLDPLSDQALCSRCPVGPNVIVLISIYEGGEGDYQSDKNCHNEHYPSDHPSKTEVEYASQHEHSNSANSQKYAHNGHRFFQYISSCYYMHHIIFLGGIPSLS
jgi:hypothetical protein